jgi:predicted DNA-binding transcriptional regulator YafY
MARSQLSRLVQLILVLQRGRCLNARELAEACEVSRRTIYRDLESLAQAGIPVRFIPERQGYQLASSFVFEAAPLGENEVVGLVLQAHGGAGFGGAALARSAREGIGKLLPSLPPESREHLVHLAEALVAWDGNAPGDTPRTSIAEVIVEALKTRRQLRISYLDSDGTTLHSTKLSLYRLVRSASSWYLVGRSTVHCEVRSFAFPRIEHAELMADRYTIPPRFNLERYLGLAWRVQRGPDRYDVRLRFSAGIAPEIRAGNWHRTQRLEPQEDGRLDLCLTVDGLEEIHPWILSFGADVEVIEPALLREHLSTVAYKLLRAYVRVNVIGGNASQGSACV